MRALPPQSSQTLCLNGNRDSTRPVARHVGQSASVGLFVTMARDAKREWQVADRPHRRRMLSPLLRHLLEQLLTPDRRNPARAVALIAKPITSRKTAGHSAASIANRAHVIFALKRSGHHIEYKAKMRPYGVHQTASIY
jgi:hypothetical protein